MATGRRRRNQGRLLGRLMDDNGRYIVLRIGGFGGSHQGRRRFRRRIRGQNLGHAALRDNAAQAI
ncbi:MAG: hypothetical protein M5U34_44050 [Chloroflexi bacterium]|nr:hypothetical protein [Chloroflexota bacterium]